VSSSLRRTALPLLALVAVSLSGCGDSDEPAVAPAGATTTAAAATATNAGATPSATESTAAPDFDLLFVSSSAPACSSVWISGATLPVDYEWCSDAEGNPVSGVRIGSCEVVVYAAQFYAVPGYHVHLAAGDIEQDRGYLDELTSCQRGPVPGDETAAAG